MTNEPKVFKTVLRLGLTDHRALRTRAKAWAKQHAAAIDTDRAVSAYLRALIAADAEIDAS